LAVVIHTEMISNI